MAVEGDLGPNYNYLEKSPAIRSSQIGGSGLIHILLGHAQINVFLYPIHSSSLEEKQFPRPMLPIFYRLEQASDSWLRYTISLQCNFI